MTSGAAVWYDGSAPVSFSIPRNADPVVTVAAGMFSDDMEAVTRRRAVESSADDAVIRLFQLDTASPTDIRKVKEAGIDVKALQSLTDGFAIREKDGVINIAGANGRGVAYGLLEMSRKAGVSPWIWWGDVVPEEKGRLEIEDGYSDIQGASVERRGIFINDEDWSIRPWSHLTFEPSSKTELGPRTYRKLFELLLRLRGNTLWPAMHEGTTAFFLVEGAKAPADSSCIIIGTSQCQQMLLHKFRE